MLNVNKLTLFFAERLSETCLDTHYVNCQLMFHSFSFSISVSSTEFVIILKLRNFVYQTARLNLRPYHFKNMNEIVIKKCPLNSNGIFNWFFSAYFIRKVEVKKNWKAENFRNFHNLDERLMTRSYSSIHSATFNFDKVNKIKAKKWKLIYYFSSFDAFALESSVKLCKLTTWQLEKRGEQKKAKKK